MHQSACSLVGLWAYKPDLCWFVVRGKHCWLIYKPWLKPTSEQAECKMQTELASELTIHIFYNI